MPIRELPMSAILQNTSAGIGVAASAGADGLRGDPSPPSPAEMGTRTGSTDDVEVTGALPAVDLGEGHLHVSTRRDVTILGVDGGLDDALGTQLAPLVESALADAVAVIIDLDQATLLDRTALRAVCHPVHEASEIDSCIVSGRLSSRLVLERWQILDDFVVFSSTADALQARAFLESGYGNGWSNSRPR